MAAEKQRSAPETLGLKESLLVAMRGAGMHAASSEWAVSLELLQDDVICCPASC